MAPSTDQEDLLCRCTIGHARHSSCEQRRQGMGQLKSQASAPPPQSPVLDVLGRGGMTATPVPVSRALGRSLRNDDLGGGEGPRAERTADRGLRGRGAVVTPKHCSAIAKELGTSTVSPVLPHRF